MKSTQSNGTMRNGKDIEEALVFLKLRDNGCSRDKALLFTARKQNKLFYMTDATTKIDGPSTCRCLLPEPVKQYVQKGWIMNSKLKYQGTKGPLKEMEEQETVEKKGILKLIHEEREQHRGINEAKKELQRKYSLKAANFDDQMNAMKEELIKERENQERDKFIESNRVKLYQTTRHFYKELEETNTESLIVKLGAFDTLINKDIALVSEKKKKTRSISSPSIGNNQSGEPLNEIQLKHRQLKSFQNTLSSMPLKSNSIAMQITYGDIKFKKNLQKAVGLVTMYDKPMFAPQPSSNPEKDEKFKKMRETFMARQENFKKRSSIFDPTVKQQKY